MPVRERVVFGRQRSGVFESLPPGEPQDQLNMADPFWRLKTDGLLLPRAKPAMEAVVAAFSATPPIGQIP